MSSDHIPDLPPEETGAGMSCHHLPGIAWRCFFCDEVFTNPKHAQEHFGVEMGDVVACKIKGHEGHLITYIRKLEDELRGYRTETDSMMNAWHSREGEHVACVKHAEEAGYNKGVRDMVAQGYCADPAAHK